MHLRCVSSLRAPSVGRNPCLDPSRCEAWCAERLPVEDEAVRVVPQPIERCRSEQPVGGERLVPFAEVAALLMLNSRTRPPVPLCLGTTPSQAANSRPDRNSRASPTDATMAVAVKARLPGWPSVGDIARRFARMLRVASPARRSADSYRGSARAECEVLQAPYTSIRPSARANAVGMDLSPQCRPRGKSMPYS